MHRRNREINTGKKVFVLCLALVLLLTACACSNASKNNKNKSPKDQASDYVKELVENMYKLKYTFRSCTVKISSIKEDGDNSFSVSGKVTIIDRDGDKWEAAFSGICDVDNGSCSTHNMEYGEPKRQ